MNKVPELGEKVMHSSTKYVFTVERRKRFKDGRIVLNDGYDLNDCEPAPTRQKTPSPKPSKAVVPPQDSFDLNKAYRAKYAEGHALYKQFRQWVLYPIAFNAYGDEVNCKAIHESGDLEARYFQSVPVNHLEEV